MHPGTSPVAKPGQSQSYPVGYGNGSYATPHPANPGPNNSPHQNLNQNPHPDSNRPPLRVPQTRQPGTVYVAPSTPQANNGPTTSPQYHQSWPNQNQAPRQNNNPDNRFASPRQFGSGRPSQSGATYDPPPHNHAAIGQPNSSPPPDNHSGQPSDASRNNNQSANHPGATPPNAQSHGSNSSASSGKSGQYQGNGQNGH